MRGGGVTPGLITEAAFMGEVLLTEVAYHQSRLTNRGHEKEKTHTI